MALTFAEARKKVEAFAKPHWLKIAGTFYVDTEGYEDETHYLCIAGAEEWLVDRDPRFLIADGPTYLVDKRNGSVQATTYLTDPDRYDRMTPVTA